MKPSVNTFSIATVVLLLLASVIPVLGVVRSGPPFDDAMITLVYARSLAQGDGFRAHPEADPSLGTTTPVLAMTVAALSKILPFFSIPVIAKGLYAAAWIATAFLWALWSRAFGLPRLAGLCIGLLILIETTFWFPHTGNESRLFCLLLTLCLGFYLQDGFRVAGLLAGLLFLTRPEGLLVFPAFLVYEAYRAAPQPGLRVFVDPAKRIGTALIASLLLILPWVLYAYPTFGSVLPQTVSAKSAQSELGFIDSFGLLVAQFLTTQWDNLGLLNLPLSSIFLSSWLVLGILGLGYALIFYRRMLLLAIWAIGFFVGYILLEAPGYTWYPLPIVYAITVFAGLSVYAVGDLIQRAGEQFQIDVLRTSSPIVPIVLVGLLAFVLLSGNIQPRTGASRATEYAALADWINTHTPDSSTVAYIEVGHLAWHSERQVVDLLGLISPELLPMIARRQYAQAFEASQPDYFIHVPHFNWHFNEITSSPFFLNQYTPVMTRSNPALFGGEVFTIYHRTVVDPPIESPQDRVLENDWTALAICGGDYTHILLDIETAAALPDRQHLFELSYLTGDNGSSVVRIPLRTDTSRHTYTIPTQWLAHWNTSTIDSFEFDENSNVQITDFRLSHAGESQGGCPEEPETS